MTLEELARTKIDILVVHGGEKTKLIDENDDPKTVYARSKKAVEVYNQNKNDIRAIFCCGQKSGLNPDNIEISKYECFLSKKYIVDSGIDSSVVLTELNSKDTLSNLIYLWDLLEHQKDKAEEILNIGVINEPSDMSRVKWTFERVYGNAFNFIPVYTDTPGTKFSSSEKGIVETMQNIDLNLRGLKPGDKSGFEKYLRDFHPFTSDSWMGFYNICCKIASLSVALKVGPFYKEYVKGKH